MNKLKKYMGSSKHEPNHSSTHPGGGGVGIMGPNQKKSYTGGSSTQEKTDYLGEDAANMRDLLPMAPIPNYSNAIHVFS